VTEEHGNCGHDIRGVDTAEIVIYVVISIEVGLMDEGELRKLGYIRIDQFCRAMDTWAQVCQRELPIDTEYQLRWRKEFSEHWRFIRLAIAKSCLLDRLIYGGEQVREKMCPIHKGHWSGCNLTGEPCDCAHDSCITGWLQNPGDPKSDASFKVMLLSDFKKDITG
jgi:hypothetical protein